MFIAKDGFIVSDEEPKTWIGEAERLAGEDDEQALALLQKALAWYQTKVALAHDEEGTAVCWTGEGVCLSRMGEIRAAREEWEEAARHFRASSRIFSNVGALEAHHDLMGNYGSAQNEAYSLCNLALARGCLKKYRKSLEAADQARDLFRFLENPEGELQSLRLGGYACASLDLREEAVERLESAARLAGDTGAGELAARLAGEIARIRKP